MTWPGALLALLVSHVAGDVLLQTDWQARTKVRGFSDPLGRRALCLHIATYMVACLPALAWIAAEKDLARALEVGAIVASTHLVIDDGRLVVAWLRGVKRSTDYGPGLAIAVDQGFHLLCLLGAALVAVA